MNFTSDNVVPASPEILQALQEANHGNQPSYGKDSYSIALQKKLSDVFEKDVIVYLTNTGTAANGLALSALVKSYEVIYCHEESHINTDECGAPEFYTGASKLASFSGLHGKLDIASLRGEITHALSMRPHTQKPGCISVTQATECGTAYSLNELNHINEIAKEFNLPIHMDGARFANALVSLDCKPADITWKVGVDVMSFGATKNGALCAEAIVFFNHKYAENFDYLHKRAGQLMSKSRFFACQFAAYLEDDLWLKNARHANAMAQDLAKVFRKHNVEISYPVDSNELFVKLSPQAALYLRNHHCGFYDWGNSGLYRFVTSFYTSKAAIEDFDACLSKMDTET